jgi:hypothetical protein
MSHQVKTRTYKYFSLPVAPSHVYESLPDLPQSSISYLRAELQRRWAKGDLESYGRLLDTAFDCLNNRQLDELGAGLDYHPQPTSPQLLVLMPTPNKNKSE